jgi:DNA repair photolyase
MTEPEKPVSTALEFIQAKKAGMSSRDRKGMVVRPNGRSADFIIPNFAVGCELACTYCYVARHRPTGNPLELYKNREAIWKAVKSHWEKQPEKTIPNQCDPKLWTYDIGESTDCLSPAVVETTRYFIARFLEETQAKPTFATKLAVGPRVLEPITHAPRQARVRLSLSPAHVITALEVGTSPLAARLASIEKLWDMGYEVHLNFSPVVAYEGCFADYADLFQQIRDVVPQAVLNQLACEVIFLTHHEGLHESNVGWRPEAEKLLWTPQWQETKINQRGDSVLRYNYKAKQHLVNKFKQLLAEKLPEVQLRYIF